MNALSMFIIAAFTIIFITILLVIYTLTPHKSRNNKDKKTQQPINQHNTQQITLDNIKAERDRLKIQVEDMMKTSSPSTPSSSSSSSSTPSSSSSPALKKIVAENTTLRLQNEKAKETIEQLKSNGVIGFPIKFDDKIDNLYAKEIINSFNLLMKEVKKIACKHFSANLSQIKIGIDKTINTTSPDQLSCLDKEKEALNMLSIGMQGFTSNITSHTDMNGVMDAYTRVINTVMDKVCKNGSLNPDQIYQTIKQLQTTICRE